MSLHSPFLTRKREQSFPSIQRTPSTTSPWSTAPAPVAESPLPSRVKRVSTGTEKSQEANSTGHPLRCDWDVYFSHRSATSTTNKNKKVSEDASKSITAAEKEKAARDEWSTSVVKLGGFSTVSKQPKSGIYEVVC